MYAGSPGLRELLFPSRFAHQNPPKSVPASSTAGNHGFAPKIGGIHSNSPLFWLENGAVSSGDSGTAVLRAPEALQSEPGDFEGIQTENDETP